MNVLIGCEESGEVRRAMRARGHNAWSCDVLPAADGSPYHFQCDLRELLANRTRQWDLGIFHPECTYLTNSGVCHLHTDPSRWAKLDDGAEFFRLCLEAPIARIAVENPIPHKYAVERIGRKYDQIVQPWMFGHPERKATCFWLKNLPPLQPTNNVKEEMLLLPKSQQQRLHYLSPGPERWKERSRTFRGIAEAMASQWA
jgi:hypothetical protein